MAKIKVYRKGDLVIPISEAKLSIGYQCPKTKQVFSSKRNYIKHLKSRRAAIHARIHEKNRQKVISELHKLTSLEEIVKWLLDNPHIVKTSSHWSNELLRNYKPLGPFEMKITYLRMHYSECVSNSHNCPKGGVTNWGRDEIFSNGAPKPVGYPGWRGTIEWEVPQDWAESSYRISDVMSALGFKTGTGSGGEHAHFDVIMFAADWPGLTQQHLLHVLANGTTAQQLKYGEERQRRRW